MTHLRRAIGKAKWLTDVHVLLNGGVEEYNVDIRMAEFKITCGRNGKKEEEASYASDCRERFRVV
jgi:hypothetical protein